jgi:hypothetical protein
MNSPVRTAKGTQRGAATVELALVVPLLITILLFSMFLTDLVRVKLKLQEASRYAAWEMTSFVLTDFGSGNHTGAFNEAMDKVREDVSARYANLDSVEDGVRRSFAFTYEAMDVTLEDQEVPLLNDQVLTQTLGNSFVTGLFAQANNGLNSLLGFWGFNRRGKVQAEVRMAVNNAFLPRRYLDGPEGFFQVDGHGGFDLQRLQMKNRFTVTASGWHLPDGADQTVNDRTGRAGDHHEGRNLAFPGGMWQQVDRMTFMGLKNAIESRAPGLDAISRFLPIPQFWETYVVSHNYRNETRPERSQGNTQNNCNVDGDRGGGYNGLHNMATDRGNHPRLLKDGDRHDFDMRCYDTAPFRDTHAYDDSLYRNIFLARGGHFMGCKNPMADDPTTNAQYGGDEHREKRQCSND